MRLLIIQYSGDYREVFDKVLNQGIETYHAQKYVVDTVTDISQEVEEVALLCCQTKHAYNQEIYPGIRVIGGGVEPYQNPSEILAIIEHQQPTHLVVHFPMQDIFRWGIKQRVKIMGLLADSFLQRGWKRRIKNFLWAKLLNNPQIDLVANHGLNACLSLQQIGVKPHKIIPWDFPHEISPQAFSVKELNPQTPFYHLVYVGLVQENKGVGDILSAIAKLPEIESNKSSLKSQLKLPVKLTIAGKGNIEKWQQQAKTLQISEQVEFLGLIPHQRVIELMRTADTVIVPSWHEYPEACPFTIYEALCARTPIIASDHPMFRGNLIHRHNAMIFPERNPAKLADCIYELLTNPQLYAQISLASANAWENLQIPVKWADLIINWLYNSPDNQKWLRDRTLASGKYRDRG